MSGVSTSIELVRTSFSDATTLVHGHARPGRAAGRT